MRVEVRLTRAELEAAANAGVQRRIRAMAKNRTPNQPERPEHEQRWWQSDIVGAIAEAAVCKALGVEFVDLEEDRDGRDVLDYQVRSVERPDAPLRFRSHEDPANRYILALVHRNIVVLQGHATGAAVRRHGWEEFPNCHSLPRECLEFMTDLPHPIEWGDRVTLIDP